MENHDTEAILEFLSGKFDSYKKDREDANKVKKEEESYWICCKQRKIH